MTENQVDTARAIATRAHEGQTDKIGKPYIGHPAQVAALVQRLPGYAEAEERVQRDAVVAAWLHDVVEDTPVTAEELLAAGLSERAVGAVVALTRPKSMPKDDYYAQVRPDPLALLVKTADIASNLDPRRTAQLDDERREKLAVKYAHALDALGVDRSVVDALHA